jgi:hypothetical protein|tara:strand:- start:425 stop:898 length:474 start_codon:yes stop_codon:yes gene_type:complete
MKKIIFIASFMLLSLTTACGFKIVKHSELKNFDIAEIITTGEKRINYKIKNKLLSGSKKNVNNLIRIYLDSNKNKEIKEKNIKNEITKYQLTISVHVKYEKINEKNSNSFTITKKGDYSISKQYSQTLNEENNLIELLADNLANEILDELILRLNAV